ncbi:MAG: flagellar brake protein [Sulfuriflexus sp.]|nr:flagellar brake protein [Sulfuriflexus sp.]
MPEVNEDDNIIKPSLIAAHLGRLQHERTLVKISIVGTKNSFNSMLVNVNADAQTILLDVLHPEAAHKKLLEKKKFILNVEQNGIKISFKGAVKKIIIDDDKPAYLIDFPKKILYQQRRQAFRAPIGRDTLLEITLTDKKTKKTSKGIINNVSREGLCLQFDHTEKFNFNKFMHLSSQFLTTENVEIICDVEIRNITDDSVHRHTKVGVQFKTLDKQQRQHIQNFALQMERKMIKRQRA